MLPVEKDTVRHHSLTAAIANFVALNGINRYYAQRQPVLSVKCFELLRNAIAQKIKNARVAKILRKRPQISLPSEVSAVTIAENNMNGVPIRHGASLLDVCSRASADSGPFASG